MAETRGVWTITQSRTVYDNPWIEVVEHDVTHKNGQPGIYGVVCPKFIAIGVVPIFEDGTTVLVGQHRFPHDRFSWELPEGGGAKDVPPEDSAIRELKEETGYSAHSWLKFLEMDMSNSVSDESAVAFLAWDLEAGEKQLDASEADMVSKRLPFSQALEMAMSGEILDAFTVAMLGKVHYMAGKGLLPKAVEERLAHAR